MGVGPVNTSVLRHRRGATPRVQGDGGRRAAPIEVTTGYPLHSSNEKMFPNRPNYFSSRTLPEPGTVARNTARKEMHGISV